MSSSRPGLRSVKVQVAGQTLALRTDAATTYVRELAALVDARLADVRARHYAAETGAGARRPVSTQALALLCALQLADELRQAEARERTLRHEARARVDRILGHLAQLDPTADPPPARRRARGTATGGARRRRRPAEVTPWR